MFYSFYFSCSVFFVLNAIYIVVKTYFINCFSVLFVAFMLTDSTFLYILSVYVKCTEGLYMEGNQGPKKWYLKWWVWVIVVLLLYKIPMETIKTILIIIGILIVAYLFLSKKSNEQSTVQLQPNEKEENYENEADDIDYDEPDDCYDEFEDTDTPFHQNTVSNTTENIIKDIAKNASSKIINVNDKDIYVIEQPKKQHFGWMF